MQDTTLKSSLKIIIVILTASMASACTKTVQPPTVKSVPIQSAEKELPAGKGWWFARFRMEWPKDSAPNWFMGTWIAGEVISPVLERHRQDIEMWRFHRRAKRDGHGHVFSFIFYSSAPVAQSIYSEIEKNDLLLKLQREKQITWVGQDPLKHIIRPKIEDTSDSDWPDSIRRTWPEFMMGASQMWLDLVLDTANEQRKKGLQERALYENVQNQLTHTWMMEGKRAWLHHLNALYAYQPTLVRY